MGGYIPSSSDERQKMLDQLGMADIGDLFSHIPQEVLLKKPLDLPEGLSELEVRRAMEKIASKNRRFDTIFRGAGSYNHYIPSVVKHIAAKEDYVTAYTPYQAELSQGLLQGIFEYQSMICALTGMDASNASVYDGSAAAAEAALMCRERGRNALIVAGSCDPQTLHVIRTYCSAAGMEVIEAAAKDGRADADAIASAAGAGTAAVYIQQPNFFGLLEDVEKIGAIAHEAGARYIVGVNPISLAVLKTPAECGADIAVGEGQPLGIPLSFGGPYLGFMACKSAMTRKLPGRIVGETLDIHGKRAYVLTLQAREQHIRREKAGSSICSNQALCALTAAVYMSAMGPAGMKDAAVQCMSKAAYAADKITAIPGFKLYFDGPFFHEFVTQGPVASSVVLARLEEQGILGGYPLFGDDSGCILWCVTEMNTREEIDRLAEILKEVAAV